MIILLLHRLKNRVMQVLRMLFVLAILVMLFAQLKNLIK